MALIQITPDLLAGKATELRGYKAEHEEAMNKMRSLMTNLNEIWKGDAQDALFAKYEGMQGTFTQFNEMLEDYAKLMDTVAKQMRDLDSSLASQMNSFGN